jgi:carbon monoxide dehydrogenase subunit G
MASIKKEISTSAKPEAVWAAIRDIGALHTRLVPGFVLDTRVEGNARWVTFANGSVVKERIVTVDDERHRLVWTTEGGLLTHYNASVQVVATPQGSRVTWLADLLPDTAEKTIDGMMTQGMAAMQTALGR